MNTHKRRRLMGLSGLATALVAILAGPGVAEGQGPAADPETTSPEAHAPAPDPHGGAFDELSPGNQRIARTLFEAQRSDPTRLSLDGIAAMKQSGKGWGAVFIEMKALGLVEDWTSVRQPTERRERSHSRAPARTTASLEGGKRRILDHQRVTPPR